VFLLKKKEKKMMNFNKKMLAVAMLFSMAFVSGVVAKKDPIVGAWWYNQETFGVKVYGVAVFHEDGTWLAHDSANLTQFIAPILPLGQYTTIETGNWTKTDKGTYNLHASFVLLQRGLDSRTSPCSPTEDAAAPACPTVRFDVTGSFVFDPGTQCKQASSPDFTVRAATLDTFEILPGDPIPSFRTWFKLS
jgi:hypothetical protein